MPPHQTVQLQIKQQLIVELRTVAAVRDFSSKFVVIKRACQCLESATSGFKLLHLVLPPGKKSKKENCQNFLSPLLPDKTKVLLGPSNREKRVKKSAIFVRAVDRTAADIRGVQFRQSFQKREIT